MGNRWQDLSRPPLRENALRQALTTGPEPAWRVLDVVAETGSTNADLADRARAGEAEGAVLVADHQSAGRGRRDRSWTAPPRAGIAVSVLLRPQLPAERWSWLSLLAGVAVTDALTHTCGLAAVLKWPNDVLVPMDGRPGGEPGKVAGLLAEVVRTEPVPGSDPATGSGQAVVLGLGLNVSQDAEDLPVLTATSLKLAGSAITDRDTVLRAVLRALSDRYRDWTAVGGDPRAGLAAVYRERCSTIGRQVRVQLPDGTTLEGLADGVDDEGRLLVRENGVDVVRALSAGDVVHIRT
jgi:BirA family transcriptional regulator, biotin operon repressor / biotin---[acetyl-CoA-carboxylase] ligase